MAEEKKVLLYGEEKLYAVGTPLLQIAKEYQDREPYDIVLAMRNHKLCELHKTVEEDCSIEFITCAKKAGMQAYKRSMILLALRAFYDVMGSEHIDRIYVDFSIGKGYYCKFRGEPGLDQQTLEAVEKQMRALAAEDIPIKKRTMETDKALALFQKYRMYDKERLFRYRKVPKVNIYSLNGFEDYYYGDMVPSTGYLKYFKLYLYEDGFVIQMPTEENPTELAPFYAQHKLFKVMQEATNWSELLDVDTVGDLNVQITKGNIKDIILVQEALQEGRIARLAEKIAESGKKIVMIAGPSSSGKTTFSHRLSIQLRANGLKPHPIPVDNYFVNREDTPTDADGKYNYEVLEAIDVALFNRDMTALLKGENVELPTFNFKIGKREYKGDMLRLGPEDILVIEGIHCLNDELSYALSKDSKYKIYISALTQLNLDEHNRISTTDCRLIRRIVRDARTRGTSARNTIAMWPKVRAGEEQYIFPYQETADEIFNSHLVYELSVLKQYAEPLLFGIPNDCPEYLEARRLLAFLDYFLGVTSEDIPKNSLLREFVGGSTFSI